MIVVELYFPGWRRKACSSFSKKIDFFWTLRYEVNRYFHKNRVSLFLTVSGRPPDG
jgi:hypothetical protein